MRSWQSYLVNALLRVTVKRRLDPREDLGAYRARIARLDTRLARIPAGTQCERIQAGGVPATRIKGPGGEQDRILLYLPGGGFVLETPRLHTALAARLCRRIGANALVPHYALAPEHPFPAAAEECLNVYRWLLEEGSEAGQIVLAGDSAGGALCLVTLMQARDSGLPLPRCAILFAPATDLGVSGLSVVVNERRDPMLRLQTLLVMKHAYIGERNPTDPLISPLYGDFSGLPPLLFQASSTELLLDHSERAVRRAHAAGVIAELSVWEGMPHVFQAFHLLPEADAALEQAARFVASCRD